MIQVTISNLQRRVPLMLALPLVLAACEPAVTADPDAAPEPGVIEATRTGPDGAAPGTCWGRTVSPAVVQTRTEQVLEKPPEINADGTIAAAPVYRTEERQEIVTPRRDNWFETPCAEVLTPEFISSLQRALSARDYFTNAVTGVFDPDTVAAMRVYQVEIGGPDSPVMALATARALGLVAVPRQPAE